MAKEPKTISVRPEGELAELLEEAGDAPLLLEKNGVRYRLDREGRVPAARYDPAATRAGLRAAAGSISVEDAERLKALIYRGREEGTRPAERP